MATITKRDLVVDINGDTGLTQQQVYDVIQSFLDTVTTHLENGDDVALRNFGSFYTQVTKPKVGRNPNKPGTDMPIPARTVVKFKPGKALRERVGKKRKKRK